MPFQPFYELFEEIAEQETRSVKVINDPDLPDDSYGVLEAYCNDPGCDCRRVFFNILSTNQKKVLAVIAFGWESDAFYAKWMGTTDKQIIKEMQGPVLNLASPHTVEVRS